jgi:hypothetical protein
MSVKLLDTFTRALFNAVKWSFLSPQKAGLFYEAGIIVRQKDSPFECFHYVPLKKKDHFLKSL